MADIRFNRIAVSISETAPLEWYFTNTERMEKATLYCDLYEQWKENEIETIQTTIRFLESAYNEDPSKVASLLSYVVEDLPIHYPLQRLDIYDRAMRRTLILRQLSWFFRELETIGITWNGTNFMLAVGTTRSDIQIKSNLEFSLSELGPAYLERYRGAIEALMSNNPDKLSQSVSSMRELLSAILHLLTKDDIFSGDELTHEGQPKRKARIRHVLAKSKGLGAEADLGEAIANCLDKTYVALSKAFHVTNKKDWDSILYVFKSTEYLIYYILLNK